MFDDVDPDFDSLYKEARAYKESISKLQRQVETTVANFKETFQVKCKTMGRWTRYATDSSPISCLLDVQSMCTISESLAVNLKLDTGVSMDACNYLNAMTAISNESMVQFEHDLR